MFSVDPLHQTGSNMFPEWWKKKQEGSIVVYGDKNMDHPRNDVQLTIVTSLAHGGPMDAQI